MLKAVVLDQRLVKHQPLRTSRSQWLNFLYLNIRNRKTP